MTGLFKSIEELAGNFYGGYDAVVISTGYSLGIDRKRTCDAINKVERVYGGLENYPGLWVAEGTLGDQNPETAQRTRIVNRLLAEVGIREDKIRTLFGEDTMDKVREIIPLAWEGGLKNIGISTFLLHFLRFQEGLYFAKRENLAPGDLEFNLIYSPTTPMGRWPKDILHGSVGLAGDAFRLVNRGFSGATPDYKPFEGVYGKLRKLVSDPTGIEPKNKQ